MTYEIKYSTDLETWMKDTVGTQVPGTPDANGVETVVVTLDSSLLSELKLFIRIEAVAE